MSIYSIRTFLLVNLLLSVILIASMVIFDNMYLAHRDFLDETDVKLIQFTTQVETFFEQVTHQYTTPLTTKLAKKLRYKIYKNADQMNTVGAIEANIFFEIINSSGQIIVASHGAPVVTKQMLSNSSLHNIKIHGVHWRINITHMVKQNFYIVVGQQTGFFSFLQDRQTRDIITIILSTYLLLGLLVWLTINRSFAVIRSVTRALMNRDQHYLEPIDIHHTPIELCSFVSEINRLLSCLHEELEREKRFAADASHELKNSLAIFYTQVEVALKVDTIEKKDQLLNQILLGIKRSIHLIQQLLALSRTLPEATIYTTFLKTDMVSHIEKIIKKFLTSAKEKSIKLTFKHSDKRIFLTCNPTAMEVLIRNLLDNAIAYTPTHGNVTIGISKRPKHVILSVIDSGPGIPKHLRNRVFDRFFRVVGSNSTGSGLGLSIIEQIVKLHRATISLSPGIGEEGLHVKIVFPSDLVFKVPS